MLLSHLSLTGLTFGTDRLMTGTDRLMNGTDRLMKSAYRLKIEKKCASCGDALPLLRGLEFVFKFKYLFSLSKSFI